MRRVLLIALSVISAAALSGCPAKKPDGKCKSSAECASQEGFGKVCVEGRCQECGGDADCRDGFVCRTNKCVPKPQCTADADCPSGQACQGERCVAKAQLQPGTCNTTSDCGVNERCEANKCVSASLPPADCRDPAAFTIRFGFDQSTLTADSTSTLQKLADCLKRAPAKKVTVQGNADERGTRQYNVALGARRAEAARKYLQDMGASGSLDTVSFGKEKPICTESTEDCWAKNRRADFVIDR